jgi:hypothetical protein
LGTTAAAPMPRPRPAISSRVPEEWMITGSAAAGTGG